MPRTHLRWIISFVLLLCTMLSGASAYALSCAAQQGEMELPGMCENVDGTNWIRTASSTAFKEQLHHEHQRHVPAVTAAHTLRISTGGHQKYSTDSGAPRCKLACVLMMPQHVLSVLYYPQQDQQGAVQGNRRWLTLRTLLI